MHNNTAGGKNLAPFRGYDLFFSEINCPFAPHELCRIFYINSISVCACVSFPRFIACPHPVGELHHLPAVKVKSPCCPDAMDQEHALVILPSPPVQDNSPIR